MILSCKVEMKFILYPRSKSCSWDQRECRWVVGRSRCVRSFLCLSVGYCCCYYYYLHLRYSHLPHCYYCSYWWSCSYYCRCCCCYYYWHLAVRMTAALLTVDVAQLRSRLKCCWVDAIKVGHGKRRPCYLWCRERVGFPLLRPSDRPGRRVWYRISTPRKSRATWKVHNRKIVI